jgi:trimeric autotransporter adhesin
MFAYLFITFLFLSGCITSRAATFSQNPSSKYWVTDGTVSCITTDSETIYIGGDFRRVGPWTGSGVTIDLRSGEALPQSPPVQGRIFCAISDAAGGWFIGGSFSRVGAFNRTNLAHITAENQIDTTWAPVATNSVSHLAFHDGVLYVTLPMTQDSTGSFVISAIDAASGVSKPFHAETDAIIYDLHPTRDALLLAGAFRQVNGIPQRFVAALAYTSGELLPWDPAPEGAWVTSIASYEDAIFVAGGFISIGGEPRTNLAAVSFTTGKALSWNPNIAPDALANYFRGVRVFETNLYLVGRFTLPGDFTRTNLAVFDLPSGDMNVWQLPDDTAVAAIGVSKEYIVVASEAPLALGDKFKAPLARLRLRPTRCRI